MVDTLRAALRLLPAVRQTPGVSSGACSRASIAKFHPSPEQSTVLILRGYPGFVNCEKQVQTGTGIARFARAVLAYVGAGLSAVTASHLVGPSVLHAKELGSNAGDNHWMAAAEARGVWPRSACNRHLVPEESLRGQKLAHCPLPHVASKSQADVCHPVVIKTAEPGHSFYWSNNWDSRFFPDVKLDLQWQLSPSCNRESRLSENGGPDEIYSNRFSKLAGLQALAAESNVSIKNNPGLLMGVASEYGNTTDLELEWQLIVDPKSKSGQIESTCETEIKMCGEESVADVSQQSLKKRTTGQDSSEHEMSGNSGSKETVTKNGKSFSSMRYNQEGNVDGERYSRRRASAPVDVPEDRDVSGSSVRSSLSWRTADKEALAALVAQKAAERLENCDLPTPQSVSMLKGSLENCDFNPSLDSQGDVSQFMDRKLLASLLGGNEPTRLDNMGLPSSSFLLGCAVPTPASPVHNHKLSAKPITISTGEAARSSKRGTPRGAYSFSADNRNSSWNGSGVNSGTLDRGPGLLGEALCHSQTRAREAEKKVEEVFKEKEKLLHLFFREASLSLTYRQWVTSLQVENRWLRMYARDERVAWFQHTFFNPFSSLERSARNGWQGSSRLFAQRQMQPLFSAVWHDKDPVVWHGDTDDIMLGYTLGFAFALGLSLAGAGLMLGWSMGWILLAY